MHIGEHVLTLNAKRMRSRLQVAAYTQENSPHSSLYEPDLSPLLIDKHCWVV